MPFILDTDGMARHVDWDTTEKLGHGQFYATLVRLATHHGVQVTAFEKPMTAEPVYDGAAALAMHPRLPEPIGTRASYKVAVLDGVYHPRGLHPDDARRLSSLQREQDTDPLGMT